MSIHAHRKQKTSLFKESLLELLLGKWIFIILVMFFMRNLHILVCAGSAKRWEEDHQSWGSEWLFCCLWIMMMMIMMNYDDDDYDGPPCVRPWWWWRWSWRLQVVVGDILEVKGGDRIAADIRIINTNGLKVGSLHFRPARSVFLIGQIWNNLFVCSWCSDENEKRLTYASVDYSLSTLSERPDFFNLPPILVLIRLQPFVNNFEMLCCVVWYTGLD